MTDGVSRQHDQGGSEIINIDVELARLVSLSSDVYRCERKPAAKKLGVRVSTLDRVVRERRNPQERRAKRGDVVNCAVCRFMYIKGFPEDEKEHRRYHREALKVLEPGVNEPLARLHTISGPFIPVNRHSPRWLNARLYQIARIFRREMHLDFVQWDEGYDDGDGYIIADFAGRALGGFVVRWREWKDAPSCWALVWIWIAPPYRRQGWLRRTWEMVRDEYPGIIPEAPFSRGTATFFARRDDVDTDIRALAEGTLAGRGYMIGERK
jgi:GNAT superfamily N-acetyltransferase